MNKFKNILNDLTNGWAFLYTAIYGMVAFILGLYTAYLTYFEYNTITFELKDFVNILITASMSLYGIISVISITILSLFQKNKLIKISISIPLLILYTYCIKVLGPHFLNFNFGNGGGIFLVFYILFEIPLGILFFIIPIFILVILDLKHKITPPNISRKIKYFLLFLTMYTIVCWGILIYIVI